ncbi:IgGFc-binding protein-like [Sardina pilchardus]|uniref:IgGFc-binding protein-like n=1 Tax=Sardina pilchardus TaxID=27697 RepID=UPI002E141ACC
MKGVLICAVTLLLCEFCFAGPTCKGSVPAPFKLDLGKDSATGTCWVFGDPHYRTFDGYYFDFMGNCTYTMAKNCHVDGTHPAFEVEVRNENQAEVQITFVDSVIIKVHGYTINMARAEYGFVMVEENKWSLPVNLDNGKVRLIQSGLTVIVETDFGLRVQYNWGQYLLVSVPRSFMDKVCGLCGNFNGNDKDDLATPDGTSVSSVGEMAKSWRVPGADAGTHCRDECTGRCATCAKNVQMDASGRQFCGRLTETFAGPLRQCAALITRQVYMQNCMHDVCLGKAMKKFQCDTVQVYTDACQQAGFKVLNWRAFAGCPIPECPKNSHYESCGNACPATCGDPDAPSRCEAYCVETCTCDDGFVRNGDECIPQSQCGCFHSATGSYVPPGKTFWANDHCTQQCTCNPTSNQIECKQASCAYGKLCEAVDGIRSCVPNMFGTCMVTGDPQFLTFDGLKYDFQGTCVYEMAKMCSSDTSLEPFEVLVQNEGQYRHDGAFVKLVELNVYGYSVVISDEHNGRVMVDGEFVNLPVRLGNNKLFIYKSGWFAVVLADFGLRVQYDWVNTVFLRVPSDYSGAMCGLCGNYNYKQADDMAMPNGTLASSATELGQSWRVAEIPGCVDGCGGQCPNCDITEERTYETVEFCGKIRDPNGPFRLCHPHVDPESYYKTCLYDVCLSHGQRRVLCDMLKWYTAACQREGAEVLSWRSEDFCDVQCQSHSHYELCAKGCPATCSNLMAPTKCTENCQEGCACDDGYIMSGDKCVPITQCGCVYGNKYYKNGQVFYPNGKCEEECTCDGTVECKKFSCGPNEMCVVKNGVRACHPVGVGICSISGDPHYNTFDNLTYTFQGTCTYSAAKTFNIEGTHLQPFSVVVENEKWYGESRDPNVSVAKAVIVEVYGQKLVLRKNQIGQILVDEALTRVPLNLNEGQIQVYVTGTHVVITTDFGLKITYDLVYHVTITVPDNYRGKTCGLCGNFNGNKNDEFQLPGGKQATDIKEFGAAWKESVHGVVCDDGCTGDFCPKCAEDKKHIFEADCSILKNSHGPLAACFSAIDPDSYFRDCVYDVCMGDGDRNMLCHSIAAYVSDCQDFGVAIKDWRSPTFCPMACSPNSHYQTCAETCSQPCPGLKALISCPNTCAEGCSCDSGYFFNGTGCVKQDNCGCYFEGHTYEIGEAEINEDCTERYSCLGSGVVKQELMSCKSGEVCKVTDGIKACYHHHQCSITASGGLSLFDGTQGAIDKEGTYELVKLCNDDVAADYFRVLVVFQPCKAKGQNCIGLMYVFFNNYLVAVSSQQEIWVNGVQVSLPQSLRNGISIQVAGDSVVVEKESVLRVSYDSVHDVSVTVGETVASHVCGACAQPASSQNLHSWAAPDFPLW